MKILITIPNTKQSSRFPNKNKKLAEQTIKWIEDELDYYLPPQWQVEIIEIISENTPYEVSFYTKFEVDASISENHEEIVKAVHQAYPSDYHIHLQLTNFNRRHGLILDAILEMIRTNCEVVSSYSTWYDDYSWRDLSYGMFNKDLRINEFRDYYDGAIYCFQDPKKLFDTQAYWKFIKNLKAPVVDIDFPQQLGTHSKD